MATTQLKTRPADPRPGTPSAKSAKSGKSGKSGNDALASLRPLLLDLAVPLGSYYVLRGAGVGLVTSLALSSVLPAARTIFGAVKDRTVNGLAALIVTVNAVSIAVSFLSGDPRILLAKESAITSTIGIVILISAFTSRPLMTAGLRPFIVKGDAAKDAAFGTLLAASARFRALERKFSLVWGIALLTDCVVRVGCVFTVSVGTMVWLSSVLTIVAIIGGIVVGSIFSVPMETMVKLEAGK
jgi:hypothetical protein